MIAFYDTVVLGGICGYQGAEKTFGKRYKLQNPEVLGLQVYDMPKYQTKSSPPGEFVLSYLNGRNWFQGLKRGGISIGPGCPNNYFVTEAAKAADKHSPSVLSFDLGLLIRFNVFGFYRTDTALNLRCRAVLLVISSNFCRTGLISTYLKYRLT